MSLLRVGLLTDRAIATVAVSGELREALLGLGARVEELAPWPGFGEDEELVGEWARERGPLQAVIVDGAAVGRIDLVWAAVREVAVGALIPGAAPAKVVLLGAPDDPVISAALESLARTLSVEWARFRVTAVMLAPGVRSGDEAVAQLVCFLCSRGGEYFSGCRLELR